MSGPVLAPKSLSFKPLLEGVDTWAVSIKGTPKESKENSMYMVYIDEERAGIERMLWIKLLNPHDTSNWLGEGENLSRIKQIFLCTIEFAPQGIVLGIRDELITKEILSPLGASVYCEVDSTVHKVGQVAVVVQMPIIEEDEQKDPNTVYYNPFMALYEKYRQVSLAIAQETIRRQQKSG